MKEETPEGELSGKEKRLRELCQLREDVLLDHTAFESSIVRTQFLLNSNAQERERYADEKIRIQETAQAVRDNTAELRVQLEEAQMQLALRKTYDELAEKITSNRLLRPREDQHANLEKLNTEIAELEIESKDYAKTWAERREQFGKIIEEGMHLRRQIRDEKEEVERREGMEEREDGDETEGITSREPRSGVNTPRGGATPLHPGIDGDSGNSQDDSLLKPLARARTPLRTSTPALETFTSNPEEIDINMSEIGTEAEIAGETQAEVDDDGEAEDGEISGDEEGAIHMSEEDASDRDEGRHSRAGSHMDMS